MSLINRTPRQDSRGELLIHEKTLKSLERESSLRLERAQIGRTLMCQLQSTAAKRRANCQAYLDQRVKRNFSSEHNHNLSPVEKQNKFSLLESHTNPSIDLSKLYSVANLKGDATKLFGRCDSRSTRRLLGDIWVEAGSQIRKHTMERRLRNIDRLKQQVWLQQASDAYDSSKDHHLQSGSSKPKHNPATTKCSLTPEKSVLEPVRLVRPPMTLHQISKSYQSHLHTKISLQRHVLTEEKALSPVRSSLTRIEHDKQGVVGGEGSIPLSQPNRSHVDSREGQHTQREPAITGERLKLKRAIDGLKAIRRQPSQTNPPKPLIQGFRRRPRVPLLGFPFSRKTSVSADKQTADQTERTGDN